MFSVLSKKKKKITRKNKKLCLLEKFVSEANANVF